MSQGIETANIATRRVWAHSFVAPYATKTCNGFWHDHDFMTGVFPEPIRALPTSPG